MTPHLGRIATAPVARSSFDEHALLYDVCCWLEEEGLDAATAAARLRGLADEWRKEGEELSGSDYCIEDDPMWMAGVHLGQAEVLEALAKQVGTQERPGPEVDLVIIEHRHEVWIDLPDVPAPRLLEDKRGGQDLREHTRPGKLEHGVEPTGSSKDTGGHKRRRATKAVAERMVEDAVALRREEGLSSKQIADRLGVSETALRGRLQRRGVNLVRIRPSAWKEGRARYKMDDHAVVASAVEVKRANPSFTYREVAAAIGVPRGTLSGLLHRLGVKLAQVGLADLPENVPTTAPQTPPEPAVVPTTAPQTALPTPKAKPNPRIDFESDARPAVVKRVDREAILARVLERDPPAEPHVAVLDPAGDPIRYVLVGADGDCARTLRAAMEWVETFVGTGARPAGEYVFKRPGVKTPVRQAFPRGS